MRGQFVGTAILQHDEPVCEFERLLGVGILVNVAIQIGTGERKQQRPARKTLGKGAYRGKAAPRV